MNPDLELLVRLYEQMQEAARLEEREQRMRALLEACTCHAGGFPNRVDEVFKGVKYAYYKKLAADNRRAGRPKGPGA
jgi:hypothetical protein